MKKNYISVVVGLGLAQLALSNAPVFAQTQKPTNLDEVVVTASRSPKKQGDIGKLVRVISQEEIQKAQGRTLPELLNTVAGLSLMGSGSNLGEIKSLYMRGASTANTLILIDGIAVNDASGISGEFNIAAIAIDQIERVEILKGASSTLYGSDAVAGVINIITKKGDGKLKANAMVSAGSFNTFKEVLGLNGQIDKTSVSLNFSNLDSKGFSTAEAGPAQEGFDDDGFSQQALGAKVSHLISERVKLNAGLQFNLNKADLDGGAFKDATGYIYNKSAFLGNIGAQISLNKGDINLILSQNNIRNKFDNNSALTNNIGRITNLEGIISHQLTPFLDLTSGINYKYSETDQKSDFGVLLAKDANNNITSLYTSFFLKGGEIFRMELGGRYNKHSQYGDNFTYTLNPSVLINNSLKVYLNVSSAYRVPSLYQLYSQYGNLELEPEMAQNYETGFAADILQSKISLNFSLFNRNIKNVIDFGQIASNQFGYINQNKQKDEGLEFEVGYKPNQKFNINAFYAYVYGKVQNAPEAEYQFNLSRRPKNSVGASTGYNISNKLYLSLLYKWTDSRRDIYYDSAFNANNVVLPSYHKVDTYIQYKTKKNVTLFADVKNLFDADYNDFAGYNTMGINFNAGLSLTFQ